MKYFLLAATLTVITAPVLAADVGVSISVGEPGFYGRIDIGDEPQPEIIYRQPVIIERAPYPISSEPLYLHVPPGHEKHWRKHCREYDACGRQVYFIRDRWYNEVYSPRYRERREYRGERHDDERRDDEREHGHGRDHHDEGRGHDDHRD